MSSLDALFTQATFRRTIGRYAAEAAWTPTALDDTRAIFRFDLESGRAHRVFVIPSETTLEFSVPTSLSFAVRADVPHALAVMLLERNASPRIGFWCIERIGGELYLSCMHNAELQLIDAGYFRAVIQRLVTEADDLEGLVERALR